MQGGDISSGDNNTLFGWGAGRLLSTQSNNIAIGSQAMYSHTGQQCVVIGVAALDGVGTGSGKCSYRVSNTCRFNWYRK